MVTIKDIAQAANVSAMTVSNVIHGRTKKVSKETKERIERIMEEMQYVTNMG
ncbi:MAG: LacI family DNA-binding transcriptional regulator, partial [Lachnospiraceae bacterium]|nr:LacI family DNA-binding transcriptional regulator [Lachnospiraceae bacterium]